MRKNRLRQPVLEKIVQNLIFLELAGSFELKQLDAGKQLVQGAK